MTPIDLAQQFAILGAQPSFETPLHVGCPNLGERDRLIERINQIFERKWLTNHGPLVREFEGEIARRVGVKHCIAMCNGTVALEISMRALGLRGEVIVPSFTFIATAHALQWQKITPVFCDIDPQTHTIDPEQVELLITPRTTGIVGVHTGGRPCAADVLDSIAARQKLKRMFDAAHAFGCTYKGRSIGSLGSLEVFSFHATKFLNCGEGGAVVTNDDDLAQRVRLMSNFGFVDKDEVQYLGTNGKMSEMSAALGLTNLTHVDDFVQANRRNYDEYRKALEPIPGLDLLEYDDAEACNFQYVVVEVDDTKCPLSRDQIVDILSAENVLARRYFWPGCHRMEPYRSFFPDADLLVPNTERVSSRVFLLPTGTAIQTTNIEKICDLIRRAIHEGSRLSELLSAQESPLQTMSL